MRNGQFFVACSETFSVEFIAQFSVSVLVSVSVNESFKRQTEHPGLDFLYFWLSTYNSRKNRKKKLGEHLNISPLVYDQGCHVSGKCQGKTKFSPGLGKSQGILKECQGILAI